MPDVRVPDLSTPTPASGAGPAAGLNGASFPDNIHVEVQELEDGGVNIVIGDPPAEEGAEGGSTAFDENLIDRVDAASLIDDLMRGIDADIASRAEWMGMYAKGLELLGLRPEERPSGPRQYTSTVRHPLLLGAIVEGQARARGELLPADGPVKVRNDGQPSAERKKRADDLEQDLNHFLTVTSPEYYPDTDRGLFYYYYGGVIFKKVYRCPVRKRPVSECVYVPDLILSNDTTDLTNCRRMTHRIEASRDELQRLIDDGFYADVPLSQPTPAPTPVQVAEAKLSGVQAIAQLPEDADHVVYESYTDLDLSRYGFDGDDGIRPYVITFDKDSRQGYSLRRFWREGDDQFKRRKRFVKFGMIPGMGYLDYGFIHILGGYTRTLTAIVRLLIDSGTFANFPGGVRAKGSRLENNEIIAGPGQFPEVETNGQTIQNTIMPLPFKGPTGELLTLYDKLSQEGKQLAGTAMVEVGEGRADIPVGTIIAQIEQSTQVESSVHKRQHTAQQEEFIILKELLAEDPSVLTRNELDPPRQWTAEELMDANMVPASDPNVPAHVHRIMQAVVLDQLASAHPELYDQRAVQKFILSIARLGNADELLVPEMPPMPGAQQPDPNAGVVQATTIQVQGRLAEAQLKNQVDKLKLMLQAQKDQYQQKLDAADLRLRMEEHSMNAQQAEAERRSREAIAAMNDQTQLILKAVMALGQPVPPDTANDDRAGPG